MTNPKSDPAERSTVVTQYETMRRAALGDALPVEARCGLMLFLRRGLWGWARAVVSMSSCQPPAGPGPSSRKAPEEYRTVIYIFAAMAIRTTYQGATL
jgi:hypothetical protein